MLGAYRLGLAVVELVALFGNFTYVLGFSSFVTDNFFSYFTIQSAMLAVVVLTASGVVALLRSNDPQWFMTLRTVLMTYLVVSGIVFGLIVAQASTRSYRVDVPWSDALLHFVVPALAMVAWFADNLITPRSPATPWHTMLWVLPYPFAWLIFTLIRGGEVGWYPYFFLDPVQVGGPTGIAFFCAIVLAIFLAVTAVLVGISRAVTARAVARVRTRAKERAAASAAPSRPGQTAAGSSALPAESRRR